MQNSIVTDRLNYINTDISYYVGNIYEYDINNAYPSILKNTDFVFEDKLLKDDIIKATKQEHKYNKKEMLIRIGKEIGKNGEIGKYINKILKDSVNEFQIKNCININDIFSIKKDALFVKKHCNETNINGLKFQIKNKYNLYFYDSFSKHEYYILKSKNSINYSIKGLGKNYDKSVYNNLSKIIYNSINLNSLELIKTLQNKFLKINLDMKELYNYLPEMLLYKKFAYIPKSDYFEIENIDQNYIRTIYFEYYHNVFKSLISYII